MIKANTSRNASEQLRDQKIHKDIEKYEALRDEEPNQKKKDIYQKHINYLTEQQTSNLPKVMKEVSKHLLLEENEDEKANKIKKEINKYETQLDNIQNDINDLILDNQKLRQTIEDLRKEKKAALSMMEVLKEQNESAKQQYEELKVHNEENMYGEKGIIARKEQELNEQKEEREKQIERFKMKREELEEDYQVHS